MAPPARRSGLRTFPSFGSRGSILDDQSKAPSVPPGTQIPFREWGVSRDPLLQNRIGAMGDALKDLQSVFGEGTEDALREAPAKLREHRTKQFEVAASGDVLLDRLLLGMPPPETTSVITSTAPVHKSATAVSAVCIPRAPIPTVTSPPYHEPLGPDISGSQAPTLVSNTSATTRPLNCVAPDSPTTSPRSVPDMDEQSIAHVSSVVPGSLATCERCDRRLAQVQKLVGAFTEFGKKLFLLETLDDNQRDAVAQLLLACVMPCRDVDAGMRSFLDTLLRATGLTTSLQGAASTQPHSSDEHDTEQKEWLRGWAIGADPRLWNDADTAPKEASVDPGIAQECDDSRRMSTSELRGTETEAEKLHELARLLVAAPHRQDAGGFWWRRSTSARGGREHETAISPSVPSAPTSTPRSVLGHKEHVSEGHNREGRDHEIASNPQATLAANTTPRARGSPPLPASVQAGFGNTSRIADSAKQRSRSSASGSWVLLGGGKHQAQPLSGQNHRTHTD